MSASPIDELSEQLQQHMLHLDHFTVESAAPHNGTRVQFRFFNTADEVLIEWESPRISHDDIERALFRLWSGMGYMSGKDRPEMYRVRSHERRLPATRRRKP